MKKSFEIYLINKIPYLSKLLLSLFIVSAAVFIFLYSFATEGSATPEIKTFYFTQTNTVKLLYASAFCSAISFVLFLVANTKKKGIFVFNENCFELLLRKQSLQFPFSQVQHVYCNDSENEAGEPNPKFTMTLETTQNQKYFVQLRDMAHITAFYNKLLSYTQVEIEYRYSLWGKGH